MRIAQALGLNYVSSKVKYRYRRRCALTPPTTPILPPHTHVFHRASQSPFPPYPSITPAQVFLCEFEELHSPLRDASSQGGGVHGNAILSKYDMSDHSVIEHTVGVGLGGLGFRVGPSEQVQGVFGFGVYRTQRGCAGKGFRAGLQKT